MVAPGGLGPLFENTLTEAVAGDSAAFGVIYRTYAGRVRAFAIARGCADPDALANDVMLRIFQNLGSFDGGEDGFVRWIFTIARNRLIDMHRSASRRPISANAEIPDSPVASAESTALGRLGVADITATLSTLTVEQREVIALRLIEDLSLKDVADIVGRPVTAVKALQRRGLRRLQKELLDQVVS